MISAMPAGDDNENSTGGNRGELSPAAALMLLDPDKCPGHSAVKVTLLWMLARGILRIEIKTVKQLIGTSTSRHVRVAPPASANVPAHLTSLLGIVRATEEEDGSLKDVVVRARDEYGVGLASFKFRYILPEMIDRGLIEERTVRSFGLIKRETFIATTTGENERERIKNRVRETKTHPELAKATLAQATILVLAAEGDLSVIKTLKP